MPSPIGWLPMTSMTLALAAVLVFLYVRTQAYDSADYFRKVVSLRQIKQLDAQWELDVLKSKIGINTDYDPLVDPLGELSRQRARLDVMAAGTPGDALASWAAGLAAYRQALEDKTGLIERFKSHNAVLRNSLTFLPTAAEDFHALAGQTSDHDPQELERITTAVNRVLLSTLEYSHAESASKAIEIEAALAGLDTSATHLPGATREGLDIYLAHVRTALREQGVVNRLLDEVDEVPVAASIDGLDDILGREQLRATGQMQQFRLYLLVLSIVLAALLLWVASRLIRSYAVINRYNRELQEANEHLERRVRERTAELEETRSELVTAARKAGMAEIATSVLHNVGNVLNSVNVSAELVRRKIRGSKSRGLAKAVRLMNEHAADLGDYLTHDAKGKMLPAYFNQLVETLDGEQRSIAAELGQLTRDIEHIKEIVCTQQAHAGASSIVEPLRIADVIEDALRMQASELSLHGVAVVKQSAEIPVLLLDKHKVLLILVNLISNATHAMEYLFGQPRTLTVGASIVDQQLQVSVQDVGDGIAAENLMLIFAHGFTTRRNGHGFGLHSCALAANEMAGTLTARSAGPGKGAEFTLAVPCREVQAA